MKEANTREEFNLCRKDGSSPIMCKGTLAREMRSKKKTATLLMIIGIILVVAGIVSIVLIYNTQKGAGMEVGVTGVDSGGVKIGGFSISTSALVIVVGGIIALIGILKGRKIQLNADGSVIVN